MRIALFLGLLLLHIAIPAICIALFEGPALWLVGTVLFCLALVASIGPERQPTRVWTLSLVSFFWAVLNFFLGVSYYIQGTGFNDPFFYHLDLNSLGVAIQAFGGVFLPAVLYVVLAAAAPFALARIRGRTALPRGAVTAAWILAILTNYPLYSYVQYQLEPAQEYMLDEIPSIPESQSGVAEARPLTGEPTESAEQIETLAAEEESTTPEAPAVVQSLQADESDSANTAETAAAPVGEVRAQPAVRHKNVILVYIEGVEQLFFDRAIFGEILPELREVSSRAKSFTNVRQVKGTGWTIAGIVASQCGFPLLVSSHLASNSSMAAVDSPYADRKCLADILSEQGYRTVYMGGAHLEFAGKVNFLRTHGYQKILGRTALMERLQDPDYVEGFGLFDDSLFEFALDEVDELERGHEPYLLTLLTLDSHHPNGRPSTSCRALPGNDDPMSNAIYCSDQLVAGFIRAVSERVNPEETIIILMSDHLSLRNTLWAKIQQHRKDRRLTLMILDDGPPGAIGTAMTHFDVAPTILEAAGVEGYTRLAMGVSAFADPSVLQQAAKDRKQAADSPQLLRSAQSASQQGVKITRKTLKFAVGEFEVTANTDGGIFEPGLFVLVLDDQGHVVDTVYSADGQLMFNALQGRFVVGISVFGGGDTSRDQYFYGKFSPDPGEMIFRPFNGDIAIAPANIAAALGG